MIHLTVLDQSSYTKMLEQRALVVSYAYGRTQFGKCLIGFFDGKICHFSFIKDEKDNRFDKLKRDWPGASFVENEPEGEELIKKVFQDDTKLEGICRGTPFQEKVWRALLDIKKGETCFYEDVAAAIGQPTATRAVSNAIVRNPISYLVPCHRVVCKTSDKYKYSGGCITKKKLLDFEGFKG